MDSTEGFVDTYPLESDLFVEGNYPPFELLGLGVKVWMNSVVFSHSTDSASGTIRLNWFLFFKFQADWDDLDYGATPKGSRKMFVNLDDTDSLGRVNEMYEDDDDTQDFDDLIIALKTGGQFEPTLDEEKDLDMGDPGDEQYAMRRISIADTHL